MRVALISVHPGLHSELKAILEYIVEPSNNNNNQTQIVSLGSMLLYPQSCTLRNTMC